MSETRRQILRCIARHQAEYGWAPSITEIGEAVGLSSTASVHRQLRELERQGFIERGSQPRQIRLTKAAPGPGEE